MNNIQRNKIIFYKTPSTNVNIDIIYKESTFWLSQKQLASLFNVDRSVVATHIKKILEDEELDDSTCAKIAQVQQEGSREVTRNIDYYNLDMVIAVGYRINSKEATGFRIWATNTLREFIIKGFVLDDDRLKNGQNFGEDYFKELLERIRSIRQVNEESTNKSLIFLQSVALITISIQRLQKTFMHMFKINFTTPLQAELLLKLSIKKRIVQSQIWD